MGLATYDKITENISSIRRLELESLRYGLLFSVKFMKGRCLGRLDAINGLVRFPPLAIFALDHDSTTSQGAFKIANK
jgi:hypothetical protein